MDIPDKLLIVAAAYLLMYFIPADWRRELFYEGWKQTPLSEEEKSAAMRSKTRLASLRTTLMVLIVTAIMTEESAFFAHLENSLMPTSLGSVVLHARSSLFFL